MALEHRSCQNRAVEAAVGWSCVRRWQSREIPKAGWEQVPQRGYERLEQTERPGQIETLERSGRRNRRGLKAAVRIQGARYQLLPARLPRSAS
jgi:hypothetical protein